MKKVIYILAIMWIFALQLMSNSDINVTGVLVTAKCEQIKKQITFNYSSWAEGCPAHSRAEAYSFLKSHDFFQEDLPECHMPQDIYPPLGETLSDNIDDSYKLVDENITKIEHSSYNAYGKYSASGSVNPGANGIRMNASIVTGYCSGLTAGITFKANVYGGVITKKYFTRTYKKTCDLNDTKFPTRSDNENILFSWAEDNNNLSTQCTDANGTVQSQRKSCKTEFRCVKETKYPFCTPPENINSYVSPQNNSFHEDIELPGTGMSLHYSSTNSELGAIAKGWDFSVHATLQENTLNFNGSSMTVDASVKEGGMTIVTLGTSQMLFTQSGQHMLTRDTYTKQTRYLFAYDDNKNLISVTNSREEKTTIARDSSGKATSIRAPYGQTTYLNVDASSDLLEAQYEDGNSYVFEYDKHLMIKEIDPNGGEFLHIFDDSGKIIKVIDAQNAEWKFGIESDSLALAQKVTRASGDQVNYKKYFLKDNKLKMETLLPSGDLLVEEKNLDDSETSSTSCGMKTTSLYKKVNGKLYEDPFTKRRVLQKQTQTTPSGLQKTTIYTKAFRVAKDGHLKNVFEQTKENSKLSKSKRDYDRHRAWQVSAEGKKTFIYYDAANENITALKAHGVYKTTYKYDSKGRAIEEKFGYRKKFFTYDNRGNLKTSKDPMGRVTTYSYDTKDRLVSTIFADGHTLHYSYDANGNMKLFTTPTPTEHTFAYNGVNKKTRYISPMGAETTYVYDKQRRVTKVIKPSGKTVENTYTNGRLTKTTTLENETTYSYYCQSNPSKITRDNESLDFTYDGTLLTKLTQNGILNTAINYTYNNDFLPSSVTYAGTTVPYLYNKDNELIKSGDFTIEKLRNIGLFIGISDGTYALNTKLNNYGELDYRSDGLYYIDVKRNKNGQITRKEEILNGTQDIYTYQYDKQGKLTAVRQNRKLVEKYSYDANGNRITATSKHRGIKNQLQSYTPDDQVKLIGQLEQIYDADGYLKIKRLPNGKTYTLTYGTMGELQKVVTPTKTITYKHNALNQRVAKLIDGEVTEKYLWENLTKLLAIYDKDDNLVQRFEYADQRVPVAMRDSNGTKYYLHYDQVGTLRAVSNTHKTIIKEITYDTYGNIINDTNTDFKVPFGFAGGLYDNDTKLTRFGYRDYDAYTGKWTAKDPIGFKGGDSNLYGYVLGDPVNLVDPNGLNWLDDLKDLYKGTSSEDAKKQIDGSKGYGDNPDSVTQNSVKKGVDFINERNKKIDNQLKEFESEGTKCVY